MHCSLAKELFIAEAAAAECHSCLQSPGGRGKEEPQLSNRTPTCLPKAPEVVPWQDNLQVDIPFHRRQLITQAVAVCAKLLFPFIARGVSC